MPALWLRIIFHDLQEHPQHNREEHPQLNRELPRRTEKMLYRNPLIVWSLNGPIGHHAQCLVE